MEKEKGTSIHDIVDLVYPPIARGWPSDLLRLLARPEAWLIGVLVAVSVGPFASTFERTRSVSAAFQAGWEAFIAALNHPVAALVIPVAIILLFWKATVSVRRKSKEDADRIIANNNEKLAAFEAVRERDMAEVKSMLARAVVLPQMVAELERRERLRRLAEDTFVAVRSEFRKLWILEGTFNKDEASHSDFQRAIQATVAALPKVHALWFAADLDLPAYEEKGEGGVNLTRMNPNMFSPKDPRNERYVAKVKAYIQAVHQFMQEIEDRKRIALKYDPRLEAATSAMLIRLASQ